MLKLRKRPKNKTFLFKDLLASTLVEGRDDFLHGESLIWKVRVFKWFDVSVLRWSDKHT